MIFTFSSKGKCPNCGHEEFTSPSDPTVDAPVKCAGCGNTTTVSHTIRTYEAAQLNPERFPKKD
jgi:ribosomal protein S27E